MKRIICATFHQLLAIHLFIKNSEGDIKQRQNRICLCPKWKIISPKHDNVEDLFTWWKTYNCRKHKQVGIDGTEDKFLIINTGYVKRIQISNVITRFQGVHNTYNSHLFCVPDFINRIFTDFSKNIYTCLWYL
jgi:hypothetical protein